MKLIVALINFFYNISYARDIKRNPELRPHSVHFGVKSIVSSVAAVPLTLMMCVLPIMSTGMGAILYIFWLVVFFAGLISAFIALLGAVFNWLLQLYINRSPITWISLVILIGGIVGVALSAHWVLGLF